MKNVTLAIDDELLEKSRSLAGKRGTTLNAMIRSLLNETVEQEDRIAWAKQGMKRLMDETGAGLEPGYKWNRDENYAEREDRLLSRLERPDLRRSGDAE
jgi:predicted transcriptional regulator